MTNNIILRDVAESDLPILFEQQLEPEATAMAAFPSRDRGAFMAHWTKIMANESNVLKTIVFDGRVAGNIVGWESSGEWEVGYWIGKEYWGKGIATQALLLFLDVLKTRPLYAHVVKHNIGSRRVLEKCGFKVIREDPEEFILKLDGLEE